MPQNTALTKKLSRAEKARLTRERLFQAATEIVGENGYAETSISKITARADVAQGTFYNYFVSKQDILDQLLPVVGKELLEFVRSRVRDCNDPIERETLRIQAFFEYLVINPHFYRILNEAETFAPTAFAQHMRNMVGSYRNALEHDTNTGDITDYSDAEIEPIVYILLAARNYLAMRYSYRNGKVKPAPKHVVDAYTKLLAGGLFRSAK